MLIPPSRANSHEYSDELMPTWFGIHTNGYSRAAIPSVDAVVAQASITSRHISQCTQLLGRRSIRAAISPGITRVPPPVPPEASCVIAVLLAAIRCQRVGG